MEELITDLRYGVRQLLKSPATSMMAVLSHSAASAPFPAPLVCMGEILTFKRPGAKRIGGRSLGDLAPKP